MFYSKCSDRAEQLALFSEGAPLRGIGRRLRLFYGPLPVYAHPDPVDQLVLALIGARTRDAVALGAFDRLRQDFPSWGDVMGLREADLARHLRKVTFAERKATQLKQTLQMIAMYRGALCLEFLAPWPVREAQAWLVRLPGVGPKVSAAVLNFSTLRKRALVVDSHHFRVMGRLGVLRPRTPFDAAARILLSQHISPDWTAADLDEHHSQIKRHGQALCRATTPLCGCCPLQDFCPTPGRGVSAGNRPADWDQAERGGTARFQPAFGLLAELH